jgi:Fe-S oxidoreductase
MGYKIQEMKNIKGKTRCCGFGGMVVPINPELSLRNMKRRVSETDKDIITYCAACRESMIMGGGQALHILDLIFNDKWQEIGIPGNTGTLKSWLNRWRTKSMVRKL